MNILVLGMNGSPHTQRTTQNSSNLHALLYKTATALNANITFVASSGWLIKWVFNPTNAHGSVNIRRAFDKVGIDDTQALINIDYDPASFIPDFIIVNLGGNDYNAHISTLSNDEKHHAESLFQDAVIEMVTTLNALYPEAIIFGTHTSSNNGLLAYTVLSDLDPLRTFVESVTLYNPGAFGNPVGSGNHASEITHQRNVDLLVEKI